METKKEPSLFVRNLPYTATELDLKKFVEETGVKPKKCVIIKENNESRGFGFIIFNLSIDAEAAQKKLNQKEFEGRKLWIEVSKDDFKFQKSSTAATAEKKTTIMARGLSFKVILLFNFKFSKRKTSKILKKL
jgi:RNA recognition motif-containing protein